jgi:hypothetical protein
MQIGKLMLIYFFTGGAYAAGIVFCAVGACYVLGKRQSQR